MTIFHFLTSVSWKGRPQLLIVDTSPAIGTSIMASEPLCETSPMVRLLAGTSHCANLARKQIDLCQLELFSTCSPSSRSSRQTGQVASSPLFTLLLTTQPSTWGENCLKWNYKYKHKIRPKRYKYKDQPPLLSSLLLSTTPTRTSAPWSPSKKRQLIQFQFRHCLSRSWLWSEFVQFKKCHCGFLEIMEFAESEFSDFDVLLWIIAVIHGIYLWL